MRQRLARVNVHVAYVETLKLKHEFSPLPAEVFTTTLAPAAAHIVFPFGVIIDDLFPSPPKAAFSVTPAES